MVEQAPLQPVGGSRRHIPWRKAGGTVLSHLLIIAVGLFFVMPFFWMLSTALKTDQDIYRTPQSWWPRDIKLVSVAGQSFPLYDVTVDNRVQRLAAVKVEEGIGTFIDPASPGQPREIQMQYAKPILALGPRWRNFIDAVTLSSRANVGITFLTYVKNSLIIAFFAIIGTVVSSSTVAYGFSKIDWLGREKVFILVLASMMLPFQVTMIPMYVFFMGIGWGNTFLPLIVPTFCSNAFDVFLLRQFYRTIPDAMSDAARVDGASEWQIFTRIILPLSVPVLATITVFTFLWAWNDFTGPLLYLTNPKNFTMAIGLQDFQGQHHVSWNLLMAASVLFTVPIIIAFFFAQKTFIQGVKLTGLKE